MILFCIDKRTLQTSYIIPSYVQDTIKLRQQWCNYSTYFSFFDLHVILFPNMQCASLCHHWSLGNLWGNTLYDKIVIKQIQKLKTENKVEHIKCYQMKAAEHTKFIWNICKGKGKTFLEIIFTGRSDMCCQNLWQNLFKRPENESAPLPPIWSVKEKKTFS
jgi:hypothetical protein